MKKKVASRVRGAFKPEKTKEEKKPKRPKKGHSKKESDLKKVIKPVKSILERKIKKQCKPSDKKQTVEVILESEPSNTFRCQMAANSLDIDVKKKLKHHLLVQGVDLTGHFNIGLVLGASGSGKTTLAKSLFGEEIFKENLDPKIPIIDQFPKELSYDDCANLLSGIGLTSVPCWIRPVLSLSNGQRSRAQAALILGNLGESINVIDEWTSVVDRTVAKVMSHCVQKRMRQFDKKLILLSCHYDVIEWLNPDWIIDCNTQKFIDRRLLRPEQRERKEKLEFDIREVTSATWPSFSKYHYLSNRVPGGKCFYYGLFHGQDQIGFMCFANYCPTRPGDVPTYHSNRVVVHPDYAGMGLGIRLINQGCKLLYKKFENRVKIFAAFSSTPLYRARLNDPRWKLKSVKRKIGKRPPPGTKMDRKTGFRTNVKLFSFEYIPA